jgi:hypothetical protein
MAKSGSEVCLRMSEEEESERERHYGDETFPINCITSAHKHIQTQIEIHCRHCVNYERLKSARLRKIFNVLRMLLNNFTKCT